MAMYGADVGQLRAAAAQFDRIADQLDANRMAVGNAIQISAWVGPFATQFRIQWNSEHSARIHRAAALLRASAQNLRRNADDQEQASAVDGAGLAVGGLGSAQSGRDGGPDLPGLLGGAAEYLRGAIDGAGMVDTVNDVVELMRGSGRDVIGNLPGGIFLSSALKGIGLGDAIAGVAEGARERDWSGAMSSAGDAAFTFASAPVSLLWQGLKAETGFFIPLDAKAEGEHMAWMKSQGYDDGEIADRYSGVQGFINLGNDNVERKAPWLNDIADKAMEGPAAFLTSIGIKLG